MSLLTRPNAWLLVLVVLLATGCAAGRAFRRGEAAARTGDWDTAVAYYTRAVQQAPDRPEYKIALERAMLNAARVHLARARELEEKGDLSAALTEYRRAAEFEPANRQTAAKVAELDQKLREHIEAARPRPRIETLREQVRRETQEPLLSPTSREPLRVQFTNASLRDVLNFIGNATGINVTYDQAFQDRPVTVQLDGVTIEEALNQILSANGFFYKILNERTIIVVPDTPQKRAQYEEQVIRVFYVSHADATELAQLINTVIRVPTMPVQPAVLPSKTANTITVRATAPVAAIIEKIIQANDKPRAEIVIDVEILEVNRSRAKQLGLNLSQYALGTIFSPEVAPPNQSTPPDAVAPPPPFNLNTISQGVSTADFYLAVPAAIVRFLESDSQTRLIAKPQLRGQEGQRLTLNLGSEVPVPSTSFAPLAAGGAAFNPLTSINYRPIGVIVEMTPRVTYEGEIILELTVENSTLGQSITVGGVTAPVFGTRKVSTKLRLRDGESNLLAGLIREDDRRTLRGLPGVLRIPVLKDLLGASDESVDQTDIVMLLTPRIVRSHELTKADLSPIYIGTQPNFGLTGPPPLIAPPREEPREAQPPAGVEAPTAGRPAAGASPAPAEAPAQPAKPEAAAPTAPPAPPVSAPESTPPPKTTELPPAQVLLTPPDTEFMVGAGPYTVPISITGASQLTTIALSVTFNPAVLRVRSVQEGSFMRQGGVTVTFAEQVDSMLGRVDVTLTRAADQTGASGSGVLAAIVFDAVAAGSSPLSVSGVAATTAGALLPLRFGEATVTVR